MGGGGGVGGRGRLGGGQGVCERRIEIFVKIQKKLGGGVGVGGVGLGWGPDGCERRIEVFCENTKKKIGGVRGGGRGRVGGGVRVDVNEELKFL